MPTPRQMLPPNMASELQVLDLAVNGPIKAYIRNLRAEKEAEDVPEKLKTSELMPKWSS